MKVKRYILSIVGIGWVMVFLLRLFHMSPSEQVERKQPLLVESAVETKQNQEQMIQQWLPCNFYEEASFQQSITQAKLYPNQGMMKVGVIPHHLLADVQIASFFQTAAQESYDTIVMLSTAHFAKTSGIITTTASWKTPFGILEPDTDFIQQLLQIKSIDVENLARVMAEDHGNAGLVPYVKYYFPKAKIVNVLVSPNLSVPGENTIVNILLSMNQQKKILVIGSIDFSHYLSPDEAKRMDQETERAVEAFDLEAICQFGDEHLDSPKCMRMLLKYLARLNIDQLNQLDHLSSDQLIPVAENHPIFKEGTTTYFIYSGNENQ